MCCMLCFDLQQITYPRNLLFSSSTFLYVVISIDGSNTDFYVLPEEQAGKVLGILGPDAHLQTIN